MPVLTKKIDEDNLKIARFLGLKVLEQEELVYKGIYTSIDEVKFLKFHSSFDWLMVAVCYLSGLDYSIDICDGACVSQSANGITPVAWNNCKRDVTSEDLKQALFNTVVETIDAYYNSAEDIQDELSEAIRNLQEWVPDEEESE